MTQGHLFSKKTLDDCRHGATTSLQWKDSYCTSPLSDRKGWKKAKDFFSSLRSSLISDGWRSPDVYSNLFEAVPDSSGVYLILAVNRFFYDNGFIAYVGMATRLIRRITTNHEMMRVVEQEGLWPQRWFRLEKPKLLRQRERHYIETYDPPFNVVGRRCGVR